MTTRAASFPARLLGLPGRVTKSVWDALTGVNARTLDPKDLDNYFHVANSCFEDCGIEVRRNYEDSGMPIVGRPRF